MPLSVGLLAHTGQVGVHFLHSLVKEHDKGNVKLVVLHRDGSDLSSVPKDVETRVVQLDEHGKAKNQKAVEGLDVVLTAVPREGWLAQTHLIEVLSESPTIKLLVPSGFDLDWENEGPDAPAADAMEIKKQVFARAKELGVPTVNILAGLFDNYVFDPHWEIVNTDVQGNNITFFRDAQHQPIHLTTLPYFGYAVTQLIQKPASLDGKVFQLYDLAPTGQDIVDILTKCHGSPTHINHYTEEEYKRAITERKDMLKAGVHRKWGDGDWGPSERLVVDGWQGLTIEQLIYDWVSKV
ncbi:hypothetical protein I317_05160 [Kwoniella heveanensis CBS 569]|uniref:NmrA-like domain-containing protein n=1 Tax=Kwoniella heveanensis BCC8398 TaxID=1296120 RepID=A0A1B9GV38_9TREE|nr:hypothetical protein I316_03458 [Kwoniella heveanensis BCC8398]OCF41049.1 hypothetical protein I317_05160 [Kwoniella heveanensis CBS 569]